MDTGAIHVKKALLGFDGFIDKLARVVAHQEGNVKSLFSTIPAFADRIAAAAGMSCDLELQVQCVSAGGNAPIMAQALGCLGIDATLVAAVGDQEPDAAFQPWESRCRMLPVGMPAHTLALEFGDGKVMLADLKPLTELTWERIVDRVGLDTLRREAAQCHLFGLTCYSLMAHAEEIWQGFRQDVLEFLPKSAEKPLIFFDLADMSKHDPLTIRRCVSILTAFRPYGETIVGLNQNEATHLMGCLGIEEGSLSRRIDRLRALDFADTVLVHPRDCCYVADGQGVRKWQGELVERPIVSTGGGDHFNAGFCAARLSGADNDGAARVAMRVSHDFVATGRTPIGNAMDWVGL